MVSPRDAFGRFQKKGVVPIIKNLSDLRAHLTAGVTEAVRRLQLFSFQALTTATPVDQGTARSGWTPSVGSPIVDRIDAPKDGDEARAAAAARLSENKARAEALARTYVISQGPAFLSNAVPWIVPLNEGSSSQAAAKFVERAIDSAIRAVNRSS